jgi:hypothetical protein
MAPPDQAYREQLMALLDGHGAHMPFDEAIADFPESAINTFPANVPYTPWHLIEHMRLTQRDMLDYATRLDYSAGIWPVDFWPERHATATWDQWTASVQGFLDDRATLRAMVANPERDILAPIPRTPGHTLARGVRIIGDHNAYHTGEFAILRQVMGTWPEGHRL